MSTVLEPSARDAARAGMLVVRVPRAGWSARVDRRAVLVTIVLVAVALGVFAWSLTVGDYSIALRDVVRILLGRGEGGPAYVVRELRLPRGLTALLVGAAFGLAGAIFQRLAHNPLASPDIIGINAGASAAAAFAIIVLDLAGTAVTAAALVGAALAATAMFLLAYTRGVAGYRLVLVGIGVHAVLTAATQYLMSRARITEAQQALVWLTGSLNARSWDHVRPVAWALAVLVPLALGLARQIRVLELGDDTARALGARVDAARGGLFAVGVVLTAIATASTGPIGFVALVAPQIARRLVGGRVVALVPAAAVGAALVVASDLIGRRLLAPTELPVGVVTSVLGAPYLLYLLARANRIGRGG